MTQGNDNSKQYPKILDKDGFSVIGYTNNSPIIQTPDSIFNAPETTLSHVMEPVIMGRDSGGDWTPREVELRRNYIEENITFRHRQKWDMLPEWHKEFYVKTAYSPLLIPIALEQIDKKDRAALQQWYSGLTIRNDARLRMSLKEIGDIVFPLPIKQGVRKDFRFALAILIRDYNLPAYGTAADSCKMLEDVEIDAQIERLSLNITVCFDETFSICESGYCFHGVAACLDVWKRYVELRNPLKQEKAVKQTIGKHYDFLNDAIHEFHQNEKFKDKEVTAKSLWANLPELCPALVLSIQGEGEASQAIMKLGRPLKWRAFKEAFRRHQKNHSDT